MTDKLAEQVQALVEALREARGALHFHYVEWDGEPEDAVPLQLARSKCDAALSSIDLPAIVAALEGESRAKYVLSGLSSYLGVGIGDDSTTAEQFDTRIRWGIDHIGSVYRNRAASVVEECSKRPTTTWGEVKKAILNDTSLPPALSTPPTESKEP